MSKKSIDFNLYLITDRKLVTRHASRVTDHASLVTAVRQALKGGVKAVQLREKDLDTGSLLKMAYKMRILTEEHKAKLFINDRFDIALAVGADGVHLTQSSMPVSKVRETVKKRLLIGVSAHSMKEAKEAEKGGADFITFGPVYRTPSKLKYGKPVGIDVLKQVSRKTNIPIFAIGGINSSRIKDISESGAHGVAMIREVLASDDIKEKSQELNNLLGA
jgi:thiamine-phosphate pyrophosphorylase